MKGKRSIQVKAAFLLTVFSLNTLVGFACSVGLRMGFNESHPGKKEGKVHIHKDGKKHVHQPVTEKNHPGKDEGKVHIHKDGKKHVRKPATGNDHHAKASNTSKKDDCCKEKVVKLQTADKNFQYAKININAPVYIVPSTYSASATFRIVKPYLQEYTACHFHPPPRDIRIEIQSFQI
ncbi:MAG: hypothetical protein EPO58_05040 [Chitinophagaceae bacterium]|jgi:hypothetical protein|nr:MAG: hypothetical protein EPO58_05040 [Chitinophagaceae bacterium]